LFNSQQAGQFEGDLDMPRTLLVCASALLFAGLGPSAFADEPRSEVVRFGDLDLYDASDADVLVERIRDAAERVCGDDPGREQLSARDEIAECAVESADEAVADLNHPMVIARYRGLNPEVVIIEEGSADPYPYDYIVVRKKK
jgi:UrcA family protein